MSELISFVLGHGDQFRRQRLPSLYADFTLQRHSNPDGFAVNTLAWIDVLEKAAQAGRVPAQCGAHDTLSLRTGDDLLQALETKEWGRPLALGTVVDEAVAKRRMIPYAEFFAARKSIYHRNWTIQPWWLLSWSLQQFGLLGSSTRAGTLPESRFVILQNVEEAGRRVTRKMSTKENQVDRIYPMALFRTEAANTIGMQDISDDDLTVLLLHLCRDKSAICYDNQTVKIRGGSDVSTTLTEQDKTVSSLKSLIGGINTQVAELSSKIVVLSKKAQVAIANSNRTSALAALRSKKLNESLLSQRFETLSQLEEVYAKIEQAADQVAIVRVLKGSTEVLQNLHAETGGVDNVEAIVDKLRDEMSKVDEVSSAIESGMQNETVIDDTAIDEELEVMERRAKTEVEKREALETQERLANINSVDKASKLDASHEQTPAHGEGTTTQEETEALKRLSLDEGPVARALGSDISQVTA